MQNETDQFRCSSLSMFNNLWYQVYDFNACESDNSWCLLPYVRSFLFAILCLFSILCCFLIVFFSLLSSSFQDVDPEMYFTELSRVSKIVPPSVSKPSEKDLSTSVKPSIGLNITPPLSMSQKLKVRFKPKDRSEPYRPKIKSAIDPECLEPEVYEMNLTFDPAQSAVPKTKGVKSPDDLECCLIIFFADGNRERKSRATFAEMYKHKVRTRKEN